jgi:hypothetical protein
VLTGDAAEEKRFVQGVCYFISKIPKLILKKKYHRVKLRECSKIGDDS